jgi:hypothetical protein
MRTYLLKRQFSPLVRRPWLFPIALALGLYMVHLRGERPFTGHLEELSSTSGLKTLTGEPYIVGKWVVIDKTGISYSIDDHWALPGKNRATNPDNVRMVVVLDHSYDIVGSYGGYEARREKCTLTVIDRMIPAIVHSKVFYGGDPPREITVTEDGRRLKGRRLDGTTNDGSGSEPDDVVIETYVRHLAGE